MSTDWWVLGFEDGLDGKHERPPETETDRNQYFDGYAEARYALHQKGMDQ